jgi:tRNA threonylcarbamoyladenosine biosynthesis protein TsaB
VTTVLAIATATEQVSVALSSPAGEGAVSLRAGRRHGESLAPAIRSLLELARLTPQDIGLVAVDRGPGLFTGLRVGIATAKALAAALGKPVVASSSLDILARPLRGLGRPVASVVDARRGECFWALYDRAGDRVSEPAVAAPDLLAKALADLDEPPLLVGDGARRYRDALGRDVAPELFDHPSAPVLAAMAAELIHQAPEAVSAMYLRGADVRIGWETR